MRGDGLFQSGEEYQLYYDVTRIRLDRPMVQKRLVTLAGARALAPDWLWVDNEKRGRAELRVVLSGGVG